MTTTAQARRDPLRRGRPRPPLQLARPRPARRLERQRRLVHRARACRRGGEVRPGLHRRQPVHHAELAAPLPQPPRAPDAALGARRHDEAHRPRRHRDHLVQRALQPGPPLRLPRPDQPRSRRLERRHHRRRGTAGNYGRDEHYDYDTRYGRAHEFFEVIQGLWDSYEDDAFPRDRETGVSSTRTKQHALNHEGDLLPGAGPAQHRALAAGPAGDLPGRRLRPGPRPRRAVRRGHLHPRPLDSSRPGLPRRHAAPRRREGPRPRRPDLMPGIAVFVGDTDDEARALEQAQADDHDFDRARASSAARSAGTTSASTTPTRPSPTCARPRSSAWKTQADKITELAPSRTDPAPDRRAFSAPKPAVRRHGEHVADPIAEWFAAAAPRRLQHPPRAALAVPALRRRGGAAVARARDLPPPSTSRPPCAATSGCRSPRTGTRRPAGRRCSARDRRAPAGRRRGAR